MAQFVFGMNVSIDGYVDYQAFDPDPVLFAHFIEATQTGAGSLYGRKLYEIMRYWDEDRPEWSDPEREFARAWRDQPKWVVSKTLTSVGPNATLISDDIEGKIRAIKGRFSGVIDVGGPVLAAWLGTLGLIDEYRLYTQPVVLGHGDPFFHGDPPPLRLNDHEQIGAATVCLSYVPA